jgi:hypothetical protein
MKGDGMKHVPQGSTDLATLASLMGWAERSSGKVGTERVKTILGIYELCGYMSSELKDAVLKLIDLSPSTVIRHRVSLRDCIVVLLELSGLMLGYSSRENAVLDLLTSEPQCAPV